MKGIYGYYDNIKQKVVYIGQSKDIQRRLIRHSAKYHYDEQQINKVIQNNPDRYESFILCEGDFTTDELNELEYEAVEIFKTNRYKYPENEGFNFRDGGEVKEIPEETKQKISENNARYWEGKTRPEKTKKKMSEAHKDKTLSKDHKQKISESLTGIKREPFTDEHRKKLSEAKKGKYTGKYSPSWHNYATIHKAGINRGKQRYAIRFNGKDLKFSIYPDKLLNWFSENYPCEILRIPKKEEL